MNILIKNAIAFRSTEDDSLSPNSYLYGMFVLEKYIAPNKFLNLDTEIQRILTKNSNYIAMFTKNGVSMDLITQLHTDDLNTLISSISGTKGESYRKGALLTFSTGDRNPVHSIIDETTQWINDQILKYSSDVKKPF